MSDGMNPNLGAGARMSMDAELLVPRMRYQVVVSYDGDVDSFMRAVQGQLDAGWTCQGGLAAVEVKSYFDGGRHLRLFQAMVKHG